MSKRRDGDNVFRGQFGRRRPNAPRQKWQGTNWISPDAYNALSREEKQALAARRQQSRNQAKGLKFHKSRKNPRRGVGGYLRYRALTIVSGIALIFGVGFISDRLGQRPVATVLGSTQVRENFHFCHIGGGTNCVVDGDTIWLQGENIRISDIDAPETHEYGCQAEKELGDRATQRLLELVNGGLITLQGIDRDTDTYGRKLRLVLVDGKSVGDTLVSEGLARYYEGGKRPWC
jgi:endonuclease YncB( thermonuclease family)